MWSSSAEVKSHCSCHNGLPRIAVLVPRPLPWTSVWLLKTATENLPVGFQWILWDSLQRARALVCVRCCLVTTLSDTHPRAEDHCVPGPKAVRERAACGCAFTFEWATCGWGICLLTAGTKPQESVASWDNASGWEVQSVIFALGPVSSAQHLHRSKAQCLIMAIHLHKDCLPTHQLLVYKTWAIFFLLLWCPSDQVSSSIKHG